MLFDTFSCFKTIMLVELCANRQVTITANDRKNSQFFCVFHLGVCSGGWEGGWLCGFRWGVCGFRWGGGVYVGSGGGGGVCGFRWEGGMWVRLGKGCVDSGGEGYVGSGGGGGFGRSATECFCNLSLDFEMD